MADAFSPLGNITGQTKAITHTTRLWLHFVCGHIPSSRANETSWQCQCRSYGSDDRHNNSWIIGKPSFFQNFQVQCNAEEMNLQFFYIIFVIIHIMKMLFNLYIFIFCVKFFFYHSQFRIHFIHNKYELNLLVFWPYNEWLLIN